MWQNESDDSLDGHPAADRRFSALQGPGGWLLARALGSEAAAGGVLREEEDNCDRLRN